MNKQKRYICIAALLLGFALHVQGGTNTNTHDSLSSTEIAHQILSTVRKEPSTVIDAQGITELDIVSHAKSKKSTLASVFNQHISTVFGHIVLEDILTHPKNPKDDQTILEQRQNIIKLFKDNHELADQAEALMHDIKKHEASFLSLWQPEDDITQRALKQVYFTRKGFTGLNKNACALQSLRIGTYVYQGLGFIPPTLGYIIIPALVVEYASMRFVSSRWDTLPIDKKIEIAKALNQTSLDRPVIPSIGKFIATLPMKATRSFITSWLHNHNPKNIKNDIKEYRATDSKPLKIGIATKLLTNGVFDVWWAYRARSAAKALAFDNSIAAGVHKKVYSAALMFNSAKKLIQLCRNEGLQPENCEALAALVQLCERSEELSHAMQRLTALLANRTLRHESSLLALYGISLAAYELMKEVKDQWAAALYALGEFEVYLSVARYMQQNTACFVQFVESDRPYFEATRLYNPLASSTVHGQNIALGAHAHIPNILITGPNGSGKSTLMKSVLYSLIGSLTFKVAFADSCRVAPVNKIYIYFSVQENIDEGLSTFMAERKLLDSIEQKVKTVQPGECVIVAVDEGVKGTIQEEGERLLYNFYHAISTVPQSLFMGATHFEYPTELEEATHGNVINAHLGLIEHTPGQFERTFALKLGKNDWWFTEPEKRQRFLDWLKIQY